MKPSEYFHWHEGCSMASGGVGGSGGFFCSFFSLGGLGRGSASDSSARSEPLYPAPPAFGEPAPLGGHALDIVGVDVDAKGRVVKFKARNTWGTASGDGGYYYIYPDYFREFVTDCYIPDEALKPPAQ